MAVTTTALAVAGLAGGAMSAYGSYQQGQSQQAMGNYNASVAEQEAVATRAGAARENEIIQKNADLTEFRQRKQQATDVGSMIGAYSRAGVSVGTGSALDNIKDSIANSELEIQIGQWNAKNDVSVNTYNSEVNAMNKESEAKLRRMYGASAATNATYGSIGTLLSSGTQYGSYLSKEKTKIGQ